MVKAKVTKTKINGVVLDLDFDAAIFLLALLGPLCPERHRNIIKEAVNAKHAKLALAALDKRDIGYDIYRALYQVLKSEVE